MSIRTRHEALSVLGLTETASPEDIKTAYRSLIKLFHPDEHPDSSYDERYYLVTEAYEFLASGAVSQAVEMHPKGDESPKGSGTYAGHPQYSRTSRFTNVRPAGSGPVIFGESSALNDAAKRRREYQSKVQKENRLEKNRQKAKEERLRKLEEEGHRIKQEELRREDLYKQAMAKIEAIQAAMAIEAALAVYKEKNGLSGSEEESQ